MKNNNIGRPIAAPDNYYAAEIALLITELANSFTHTGDEEVPGLQVVAVAITSDGIYRQYNLDQQMCFSISVPDAQVLLRRVERANGTIFFDKCYVLDQKLNAPLNDRPPPVLQQQWQDLKGYIDTL